MPAGDEATQAQWEQEAARTIKLPHDPFAHAAKRRKIDPAVKGNDDNVLTFLKSRPQIASMKEVAAAPPAAKRTSKRNLNGDEAADLLYSDRFKGHAAARQQDETIDAFLKRLPVADPATAHAGPWLWVSSSQIPRAKKQRAKSEDVDAFIEQGESLLEAFIKRRSTVDAENHGKAPATITRYMRPHRDKLENDLLSAAVSTGTTCGKWMLFPNPEDLPRFWRVVAEATAEGKLGPVSKVGTYDPLDKKDATLICVYTYDFTDNDDVRRVLDQLVELGLCRRDGKPIYYKCDAYTYLGIASENTYKLRASLFSSGEVLKNEAKVLEDGQILRGQRKSTATDSFFAL